MWEALVVAGLVAAFLAVAGLSALTVYRLWSGSGMSDSSSGTSAGGSSGTSAGSGADVREG